MTLLCGFLAERAEVNLRNLCSLLLLLQLKLESPVQAAPEDLDLLITNMFETFCLLHRASLCSINKVAKNDKK